MLIDCDLCRKGGARLDKVMKIQTLQVLLLSLQILLLIPIGYLILLTVAAWFARRATPIIEKTTQTRFIFLIPAHNEESLLPDLLESIALQDYPKSSYEVHVIADNCTDDTANVAATFGAHVHTRQNETLIGKGYALEWGLNEIRVAGQEPDAYLVVDANSTISSNFLSVMHQQVASGAQVVQAYYGVREPGLSWNVSLRYAALTVLHFLRPQGRMVLGGSAGLKGNGMLFRREILAQYPWPTSVTEDIEYHMLLLLGGSTVRFAPDASVWGEMPERFEQSQSQLDRWESGRLQMARKYVPSLLQSAARSFLKGNLRRAYCFLDAALEHLIPPFSILFGMACLLLLIDAAFLLAAGIFPGASMPVGLIWTNAGVGLFLVLGQIFYLLSGLKMTQAPVIVYKQLLFAPLFMVRKIGQYAKIMMGRKPNYWVKTTRNQP